MKVDRPRKRDLSKPKKEERNEERKERKKRLLRTTYMKEERLLGLALEF